jgi:hypothetical protein
MNFKYFVGCKNIEEAKKIYKAKAKELHPDISGKSDEEFKVLNSEYQHIKQHKSFPIKECKANSDSFTARYTKGKTNTVRYYTYNTFTNEPENNKKEKVDTLLELVKLDKIKKGAVWIMFKEYCKKNGYKIKESNIKYIAGKLGYAEGWVYFTKEKCKADGIFKE